MKSLFLLIALYTITGKQAVQSGDIPEGSTCAYTQSGTQNGQMTAGNDLTLTINGYTGMTLHSVRLSMHSNQSSGAGWLTMSVGGSEVWSIADAGFNASSWAGAYSKAWTSVTHSLGAIGVPDDAPITLHIVASKNSLYLQSVELEYSAPAPRSYTVTFDTHVPVSVTALTEKQPDAGVVLPEVPLVDPEWQFYGWMPTPLVLSDEMPKVRKAGETFFPTDDCTLHAVYVERGESELWYPTDDLSLNDYFIALYEPSANALWYAIGEVENGVLNSVQTAVKQKDGWVSLPFAAYTTNAIYTLSVSADGQLSIIHKATGKPVLLTSGRKLTQSTMGHKWSIAPIESEKDEMPHFVISGELDNKTYYLSYRVLNGGELVFSPIDDTSLRHDLLLYAVDDLVIFMPQYTSYPLGNGVMPPTDSRSAVQRVQIGQYELTIKNGKKYLQIKE